MAEILKTLSDAYDAIEPYHQICSTTDATFHGKVCCIVRSLNNPFSSAEVRHLLIGNIAILGMVIYAYALYSIYPDLYYLSVQEDEYLEW